MVVRSEKERESEYMAVKAIPDSVRQEVDGIVARFNGGKLAKWVWKRTYFARFRGQHLFLDRDDGGGPAPICRLTYTGDMKKWRFAIYKYSSERYDPQETWFPGVELFDGTVKGAMRAGNKAYET
jgi:hypothetical protein